MSTFPTSPRAAFLLWCQEHAPVFTANAAAIGLTPAQATAFAAGVTALENSVLAQEAAKQAYRAATLTATDDLDALKSLAGDTVRNIRTFAENSDKPSDVYAIAQIPAPAPPSPAPPPVKPGNLSVTLDGSTGNLTLRWKAANPAPGTTYLVRRKLPGEAAFSFLGTSGGSKMFVDTTFIAGPDSVQYTVQGQRAGLSGPVSDVFLVTFGQPGGGGGGGDSGLTVTSLGPAEPAKLAA